ncbi:MAG: hypothetical protein U1A78_32635 [Polyangia bacterium]
MQSNTTSDVTENQVVLNNAAPDITADKNKGIDKGVNIPSQDARPTSTDAVSGNRQHNVESNTQSDAQSDSQTKSSTQGDAQSKSQSKSQSNTQSSAKDSGSGNGHGAAKADDPSADADKSAECAGATGGNREQLRRRVEARVSEIEAESAKICEGTNTERAQALSTALQVARDVCGTGWEHVGELEAVRLSQWLDTTEPLVATGKQEETGVMLGGAKPHGAALNQATAPLNATTTPDTDALPTARPVTADYPRS